MSKHTSEHHASLMEEMLSHIPEVERLAVKQLIEHGTGLVGYGGPPIERYEPAHSDSADFGVQTGEISEESVYEIIEATTSAIPSEFRSAN